MPLNFLVEHPWVTDAAFVFVALVAGCAAAAALEIVQALVPSIGRSCTVSDWLWNAIGASLGAAIAVAALRLAARTRPRVTESSPDSEGDTSRIAR